MLSAVKLWKSVSISGPAATAKPMDPNNASTRARVRVIGCSPPTPGPRPGSVTSSFSCARWAASLFALLELALGAGDQSSARAPLLRIELAEAFELGGKAAVFAQIPRLGVLELGGILDAQQDRGGFVQHLVD